MFMRIDKLQIDLPKNSDPDPEAAAAVNELLGGKYGEMSTLNNYMFQSFNMRGRETIKPFYDLVASITAEEFGHVELVSAAVNLLLNGGEDNTNTNKAPLEHANKQPGNRHHFLYNGNSARVADAMDFPWNGNNVFSSGNLATDMLHNYFLESAARMQKLRVHESTTHPVARRLTGYLLVRGGVHQIAYAVALEKITGVEVSKMLPVPDIRTDKIDECKEFIGKNLHNVLFRFSQDDYKELASVFNGTHPEDGSALRVVDGVPDGHELAVLPPTPASGIPSYDMDEIAEMAKRLMSSATVHTVG